MKTVLITDSGGRRAVEEGVAQAMERAGLIAFCCECDAYHHEEYERWEEVDQFIESAKNFFSAEPRQRP